MAGILKTTRKRGKGSGPNRVRRGRKSMGNPKGLPFRMMGRKR